MKPESMEQSAIHGEAQGVDGLAAEKGGDQNALLGVVDLDALTRTQIEMLASLVKARCVGEPCRALEVDPGRR